MAYYIKQLRTIPPWCGLPEEDLQKMYWPENLEYVFYYVDHWLYNELIQPYTKLFKASLYTHTDEFPGLNNIYWADQPWEAPSREVLEGQEIDVEFGPFDRRAMRFGDNPNDRTCQALRSRKTATNVWMGQKKVHQFRARHFKLPLATLTTFLNPSRTNIGDEFTFPAVLNGEGVVVFVQLTPWSAVRLDDWLDGIPLARAFYEYFKKSGVEATRVKREYIKYAQRILFDGPMLGVCTDPWALLVPSVTKGKRIRGSGYFRQRVDSAARLLTTQWAHIEANLPQIPDEEPPKLKKTAWAYVTPNTSGFCEFKSNFERACIDVRGETRRFMIENHFGPKFMNVYRIRHELCLSGTGFAYRGHAHPLPAQRQRDVGWLESVVPDWPSSPKEKIPSTYFHHGMNPGLGFPEEKREANQKVQIATPEWVVLHHEVNEESTIHLNEQGEVEGHTSSYFNFIPGELREDGEPGTLQMNAKNQSMFTKSRLKEASVRLKQEKINPYHKHFSKVGEVASVHIMDDEGKDHLVPVKNYFGEPYHVYGKHFGRKELVRRRTQSCPRLEKTHFPDMFASDTDTDEIQFDEEGQHIPSKVPRYIPREDFIIKLKKQFKTACMIHETRQLIFTKGVDKKRYVTPIVYEGDRQYGSVHKRALLHKAFPGAERPGPIPTAYQDDDPPVVFFSAAKPLVCKLLLSTFIYWHHFPIFQE